MEKPIKRTVSVLNVLVDLVLNIRLVENYDLETMKQQIRDAGRILKPLAVEETPDRGYVVLQGNRRASAAQQLLSDPACPADLRDALLKTEVLVYKGLNEQERLGVILDHGEEKPISRTELVQAVWRLDKLFFSETAIILKMYFALAKFTGNERKLGAMPKDEREKEKYLKKWFHGTVNNYMLCGHRLGEYVKQQVILTERSRDGFLQPDEKVEIMMNRGRIEELTKAMNAEKELWSPEEGSPLFNELLAKFKREDVEGKEPRLVRPSVKELEQKAAIFNTSLVRKAFLIASGEQDQSKVGGFIEEDQRVARDQKCLNVLAINKDKLPALLAEFVGHLLNDETPAAFSEYVKSLTETA